MNLHDLQIESMKMLSCRRQEAAARKILFLTVAYCTLVWNMTEESWNLINISTTAYTSSTSKMVILDESYDNVY